MPHRSHSKLTEGMREGDLADLVLPLISVDEYQSKVSPDKDGERSKAIVFGFYVHDQSAADDLNRFLQKSAVPLLDTEVSPAPDQHGYFMVFVELTNNTRLAENVTDILAEMRGLVDIDNWQMRVRDLDDLIPFSQQSLAQAMKRTADTVAEQAILRYLQPSLLETAAIDGDMLILQGNGERFVFDVIGFGRIERLLADHQLTETAIAYDIRAVARTNRIGRILGEHWQVMELNHFVMLHHSDDFHGLLLH
jgi:hypothetical protein